MLQILPLKKKYLRANRSRFVNKELNKTIMIRWLRQLTKNGEMCASTFCVNLKNCYNENLDTKDITGTMKPLF